MRLSGKHNYTWVVAIFSHCYDNSKQFKEWFVLLSFEVIDSIMVRKARWHRPEAG